MWLSCCQTPAAFLPKTPSCRCPLCAYLTRLKHMYLGHLPTQKWPFKTKHLQTPQNGVLITPLGGFIGLGRANGQGGPHRPPTKPLCPQLGYLGRAYLFGGPAQALTFCTGVAQASPY